MWLFKTKPKQENSQNSQENSQAKNFNIVIVGYGGQGVITLADFISQIALKQGFEVKQAELHGLAQRGGSVETFVRFGEKIYSPKVKRASADLIIGLDFLESARAGYWANPEKTIILTDSQIYWPYDDKLEPKDFEAQIRKLAQKLEIIDANKIAKEIAGTEAAANVFMLGLAVKKQFLPFKKEETWDIISKNLPQQYLELNQKVFEQAFK